MFPYERQRRELAEDTANRAQFIQIPWTGLTPVEAEQTMKRLFEKKVLYAFNEAYAKTYTAPPQSSNFVTFLTVDGRIHGWMWEADSYTG